MEDLRLGRGRSAGPVAVGRWRWREGLSVVGDGVQWASVAHAFALVVNNDALGGTTAFEADLHDAVGQMARRFEAPSFEREGVARCRYGRATPGRAS